MIPKTQRAISCYLFGVIDDVAVFKTDSSSIIFSCEGEYIENFYNIIAPNMTMENFRYEYLGNKLPFVSDDVNDPIITNFYKRLNEIAEKVGHEH